MGKLIEQRIPTIFQGVSRQPDNVRLPGQVQDAEQTTFSVVTGGFSKRPGSIYRGTTSADPTAYHTYVRDANEKYLVQARANTMVVQHIETGAFPFVGYETGAYTYLQCPDPKNDIVFMTVADYTMVLNKTKVVRMVPPKTNNQWFNLAVIHVRRALQGGVYTVSINNTPVSITASNSTTNGIAQQLYSALVGTHPNFLFVHSGSYIYFRNNNGYDFTVAQSDPLGEDGMWITFKRVRAPENLPNRAVNGMLLKVGEQDVDAYWVVFKTKDGAAYGEGYWKETVGPGLAAELDRKTMPHALIRQADGSFRFQSVSWNPREVGDDTTVPWPDFVNNRISSMAFYRDRFVVSTGETIYFSRAGDYFNFWPESSTQVIDSDPFGRMASTTDVNVIRHLLTFRKVLSAFADKTQFEISAGDTLTPKNTSIDIATRYAMERRCKPFLLGSELYFAASSGKAGVVLEYYYDEESLSNTATDVTIHVKGYVPAPINRIVGDTTNSVLFVTTDGDPRAIYVHQMHWDGDEKAQAAWSRWEMPGDIVYTSVVEDELLVVMRDSLNIQRFVAIPLTPDIADDQWGFDYNLHMDMKSTQVSAVDYLSAGDETRFTILSGVVNYGQQWAIIVPPDTPGAAGQYIKCATRGGQHYAIYAPGNWSYLDPAGLVAGIAYASKVTLSKQFVRDEEGSILSGRLQLRRMNMYHQDTSTYHIRVTPEGRNPDHYPFNETIVAAVPIDPSQLHQTGIHRVPIMSRGDTVKIDIINDTPLPHTITALSWMGFFNETSRQG